MKEKILKGYSRLLSFILSILGLGTTFNACDINAPVEYGMPHATYKVNGKVTNEMNKKIPGIRVIMEYDTVITNDEGKYEFIRSDFPGSQDFHISFEDIDSIDNGLYEKMDTVVSFVDPEFKNGDNNWYSGETSKEFNVQLKKEE